MKFLADMGISPKTVSFLHLLGYQAVHLHQEGLDRLSDPEILLLARRDGRILLTHDLDFGDLLAASKAEIKAFHEFQDFVGGDDLWICHIIFRNQKVKV